MQYYLHIGPIILHLIPEPETRRGPERAHHDLVHLRHLGHLRRRLRPGLRPQVILLGEKAIATLRIQLRALKTSEQRCVFVVCHPTE